MSDEVKERDCSLELTHSRHAAYGCAALCHVSGCDTSGMNLQFTDGSGLLTTQQKR